MVMCNGFFATLRMTKGMLSSRVVIVADLSSRVVIVARDLKALQEDFSQDRAIEMTVGIFIVFLTSAKWSEIGYQLLLQDTFAFCKTSQKLQKALTLCVKYILYEHNNH